MSRVLVAVLSATLALGAASTAFAKDRAPADRLFKLAAGEPEILEPLNGKPYWSSLAECSGFQSAYAISLRSAGDPRAGKAEAAGIKFLESSIQRLMTDRKLGFDDARALAGQRAAAARGAADRMRRKDTSPASQWNLTRSLCEDLAVHYARQGL